MEDLDRLSLLMDRLFVRVDACLCRLTLQVVVLVEHLLVDRDQLVDLGCYLRLVATSRGHAIHMGRERPLELRQIRTGLEPCHVAVMASIAAFEARHARDLRHAAAVQ